MKTRALLIGFLWFGILMSLRNLRLAGRYRSGQTGQTVNLLAHAFEGSNPSLPTNTELNGSLILRSI